MTTARDIRSGSRGFTLMELLIAVVAFAVVLAAVNGIYYAAVRLRNKTTAGIEQSLPLEHALTIIQRDLANLVLPGGTLSGALQTGSTSNRVAGQSSPSFYTSRGVIDDTSPWAEVERVSYLLLDSTNRNNGRDLVRSVSCNLLPVAQDQPEQQWLMTGVQNIGFLFYDGSQWRDSWDSTTADLTTGLSNTVPKAIKVQLQLLSEQTGRTRQRETPIELVVPITVQVRTNQTQQTAGGQR
jgi:type II secretion system protein J